MNEARMVDHLFRHQYGRMVAILTRIFGLAHVETVEDAVQDTFASALLAWRNGPPDDPEAWLMRAARNRVVDIFRKMKADDRRHLRLESGSATIAINELFMDDEIADSQLRMIFAACHPALDPREQIAFALKSISGFSTQEIATALLLKEETVKKRLMRARKAIQEQHIAFVIPQGKELTRRLDRVLDVLYLIFNEGFHSTRQKTIIDKELCGEALRLCKSLLENGTTRSTVVYALFALMCFHSARLDSRMNEANELIDLRDQDRSMWYFPLIALGNDAMTRAMEGDDLSKYHFEAAIAAEHLKAPTFKDTDWDRILMWYERLDALAPSPMNTLNRAMVQLQRNDTGSAADLLRSLDPDALAQRAYLLHGAWGEYHALSNEREQARACYTNALALVKNKAERGYLQKKLQNLA